MRKFQHVKTGNILNVTSEAIIKQLSENGYKEIIPDKKEEKAIKDMTKKELVAFLNEKGIETNEEMKKDDLLALIPQT